MSILPCLLISYLRSIVGVQRKADYSPLALSAPSPTELTHSPRAFLQGACYLTTWKSCCPIFAWSFLTASWQHTGWQPAGCHLHFCSTVTSWDGILFFKPSAVLSLSSLSSHSLLLLYIVIFLVKSSLSLRYKWHGRAGICLFSHKTVLNPL